MRNGLKTGVIITSAGLSTRMGGLKPMLQLGHKTVIEHMVDNASMDCIQEIVVVVGNEKEKIIRQLKGKNVKIAENIDYGTSDMLSSVKHGIRALPEETDCFFIIPGDMPLVSGASYQCMLRKYESNEQSKIIQIRYQGDGGHPILVGKACRQAILDYTGNDGLKGALRPFASDIRTLEWHNSTILMDADTPADFQRIKELYEWNGIPGKMEIFKILRENRVPEHIINHSLVVENLALLISENAKKRGDVVNTSLACAAALLHDVERQKPRHEKAGAEFLRELGYDRIAAIIENHTFITEDAMQNIDERAVVFLADKLAKGDQVVGLDQRFQGRLDEFKNNPEVYAKIKKNKENAEKLLRILW